MSIKRVLNALMSGVIISVFFAFVVSAQESPPSSNESLAEQLKLQQAEINRLHEDIKKLRDDADVRSQLEITTDEKKTAEENLLDAAGREYTLLPPGLLGMEYQFSYSYYSADSLKIISEQNRTKVEHDSNHNITQSIAFDYPLLENLTLNLSMPFVSRYDRSGQEESIDKTDLGDISFGVQWQPFPSTGGKAAAILFANVSCPTGKSPYDVVIGEELSTGSGLYSISTGVSMTRSTGSVMLFGGLNYSHAMPEDGLEQKHGKISPDSEEDLILNQVKTGDRFGVQCGLSWSMTYDISMTITYQYAYGLESEYVWSDNRTTAAQNSSSSILGFGIGWRFRPETAVNIKISAGLTNEDPDFLASFRVPFQFQL